MKRRRTDPLEIGINKNAKHINPIPPERSPKISNMCKLKKKLSKPGKLTYHIQSCLKLHDHCKSSNSMPNTLFHANDYCR